MGSCQVVGAAVADGSGRDPVAVAIEGGLEQMTQASAFAKEHGTRIGRVVKDLR